MGFISVDLGTTNVKVAAYDNQLKMLNIKSTEVSYDRNGILVEFDAEVYYQSVARAIKVCAKESFNPNDKKHQIILTGQAESLIVIGKDGLPLRKAISWQDERSKSECYELQNQFSNETCFAVTGQVSIIPTWPITKILWLKRNEPDIFSNTTKYLLLKDYIQYRLTGKLYGELSIYNFSLYLNIHEKNYWKDILSYCGISETQLPELIEPCTNIGRITDKAADELGMSLKTTVNVGTLDHFAGMIGTGNIKNGIVSESTGTVLSIATIVDSKSASKPLGIPCHYGFAKDTYVMLSVCESGGISLEWYKNTFLKDISYAKLNAELEKRAIPGDLLFLPYLTGTNAPDYNERASGVFYGLKVHHDAYDMALAVMAGVAHMLAINIKKMEESGIKVNQIISTGGGARSEIWSRIKASITNCEIRIPVNEEAACLGAAIIGAVNEKLYPSLSTAILDTVAISKTILPSNLAAYQKKQALFELIYSQFSNVFNSSLNDI